MKRAQTSPCTKDLSESPGVLADKSAKNTYVKLILGVCAREKKSRAKPMQEVLSRLVKYGYFDVIVFTDDTILNEPIETWPVVDCLLTFYSSGFPLVKVQEYVRRHQPFIFNDLTCEQLLRDRRTFYERMSAYDIPTPRHAFCSRDGWPAVRMLVNHAGSSSSPQDSTADTPPAGASSPGAPSPQPADVPAPGSSPDLPTAAAVVDSAAKPGEDTAPTPTPASTLEEFEDYILVDGVRIDKPFVEKPADAECHDVHIYYPRRLGGGCKRLFRKKADKSSAFDPNCNTIRRNGSFIYEEFVMTQGTDIKVYCIGPNYAHAEARKSPVVDGIVQRDAEGKEMRFPIMLTAEEKELARRVCFAFRHNVCGFDLLRTYERSYVCDVNGWSFVKKSHKYYDDAAYLLCLMMLRARAPQRLRSHLMKHGSLQGARYGSLPRPMYHRRHHHHRKRATMRAPGGGNGGAAVEDTTRSMSATSTGEVGLAEELRCVVAVIRHADRTPKQKLKLRVSAPALLRLHAKYAANANAEAKLKTAAQLQDALGAVRFVLAEMNQQLEETPALTSDDSFMEQLGKLEQVRAVLEKGGRFSGINRKLQLKPLRSRDRPAGMASEPSPPPVADEGNAGSAASYPSSNLASMRKEELDAMTASALGVASPSPRAAQPDTMLPNLRIMKSAGTSQPAAGPAGPEPPEPSPPASEDELDAANALTEALLVLKWGGVLTERGQEQAEKLGHAFRNAMYPGDELGLLRLHSTYRHDLKIYSSDEGRVQMSAAAFTKGFLDLEGELTPILASLVRFDGTTHMLDNTAPARALMDDMKSRLRNALAGETAVSLAAAAAAEEASAAPAGPGSGVPQLQALSDDGAAATLQQLNSVLVEAVAPTRSPALLRALKTIGPDPRAALARIHKCLQRVAAVLHEKLQQRQASARQALPEPETLPETLPETSPLVPMEHLSPAELRTSSSEPTASLAMRRGVDLSGVAVSNSAGSPLPPRAARAQSIIQFDPAIGTPVAPTPSTKLSLDSLWLLHERWRKLAKELYSSKKDRYDLSKIPDVYDSIKFDLLSTAGASHASLAAVLGLPDIAELYRLARAFADIIIPQEYGISMREKTTISSCIAYPFLCKLQGDMQAIQRPMEQEPARGDGRYDSAASMPLLMVDTTVQPSPALPELPADGVASDDAQHGSAAHSSAASIAASVPASHDAPPSKGAPGPLEVSDCALSVCSDDGMIATAISGMDEAPASVGEGSRAASAQSLDLHSSVNLLSLSPQAASSRDAGALSDGDAMPAPRARSSDFSRRHSADFSTEPAQPCSDDAAMPSAVLKAPNIPLCAAPIPLVERVSAPSWHSTQSASALPPATGAAVSLDATEFTTVFRSHPSVFETPDTLASSAAVQIEQRPFAVQLQRPSVPASSAPATPYSTRADDFVKATPTAQDQDSQPKPDASDFTSQSARPSATAENYRKRDRRRPDKHRLPRDADFHRLDSRVQFDAGYEKVKTPGRNVRTRLYFTSESHVHSLVNLLLSWVDTEDASIMNAEGVKQLRRGCDKILRETPELDYMTSVIVRVYENPAKAEADPKRFRVEILFSPGAAVDPLLDMDTAGLRRAALSDCASPDGGRMSPVGSTPMPGAFTPSTVVSPPQLDSASECAPTSPRAGFTRGSVETRTSTNAADSSDQDSDCSKLDTASSIGETSSHAGKLSSLGAAAGSTESFATLQAHSSSPIVPARPLVNRMTLRTFERLLQGSIDVGCSVYGGTESSDTGAATDNKAAAAHSSAPPAQQ